MNDKYFFGALVYLMITVIVSGFLPSGFYSGTQYDSQEIDDFRQTIDGDVDGDDDNLIVKIFSFMFLTWTINGIPAIVGSVIFVFNLMTILIVSIWAYDKFRGIGG